MPRTTASPAQCRPSASPASARALNRFAPLFKALADATRLEIVGMLAARAGELCVCEIESHFDLGQPTVSHHLRVLREAGVVSAERRGSWVYYSLRGAVRDQLANFQASLSR